MNKRERELFIFNLADDLACNAGYTSPPFRRRFLEQAIASITKALDRYDAAHGNTEQPKNEDGAASCSAWRP